MDLTHPCFAGSNVSQLDALTGCSAQHGVSAEHGLHVASVLFGQHEGSVQGIAPHCRGVVIPIFRDDPAGAVLPCSQVDLAHAISEAIRFADAEGSEALIINISGGQVVPSGEAHAILADVVRRCDKRKVLIVAAAGNQGCECLHIPGAIPSVLVVGAMSTEGVPLDFSNWGEIYREQGLLAPGENILGAAPSSETAVKTGTSFATPIVSGVAALLLSLQIKRGYGLSAEGVRAALLQAARGCEYEMVADCRRLLTGRLHIPDAILFMTQRDHNMSDTAEITAASNGTNELADKFVSRQETRNDTLPSAHEFPQIMPASCGCGGGAPPKLVYALGKLSFDYGTRARRLFFTNDFRNLSMPPNPTLPYPGNIDDPAQLIQYLSLSQDPPDPPLRLLDGKRYNNRPYATSIIWTLLCDDTPIYAIVPPDAFALDIYDSLVDFLNDQVQEQQTLDAINGQLLQLRNQVDAPRPAQASGDAPPLDLSSITLEFGRVAIAGVIKGQVTLFTGETVPIIRADPRGLANWSLRALIDAAQFAEFGRGAPYGDDLIQTVRAVSDFLNTLYAQTRNLGVESRDRALNFAATDALFLFGLFRDVRINAQFSGMEFDAFDVVKSPVCRPDSDCWDVKLYFYDPNNLMRARRVVSYTIDVSDAVPVMLGRQQQYTTR